MCWRNDCARPTGNELWPALHSPARVHLYPSYLRRGTCVSVLGQADDRFTVSKQGVYRDIFSWQNFNELGVGTRNRGTGNGPCMFSPGLWRSLSSDFLDSNLGISFN